MVIQKNLCIMENELVFKVEGEELINLREWQEHIKAVCGKYGDFEYRFSCGSGIGITFKVYSKIANIEKDFTDYSKW